MVDLLAEYIPISELIDSVINSALSNEIADKLKYCIQEEATNRVYSYEPKVLNSRRKSSGGLIDSGNMETWVSDRTLTLYNSTGLQNLFGGDDGSPLTPIIEDGVSAYHQPYPRPFMDEALDKLVDEGIADRELGNALRAAGFDVT